MNGSKPVRTYLEDTYENAEKARRFLGELEGPEALQRDELRTRAIVRALEVIGEVAKRVPAEYRARHPEIPWREMAGMRDKLERNRCDDQLEQQAWQDIIPL
ncbi:HepT-like ribonuclease domain-containing protein [Oceanithermus sp.]